MAGSTARPSVFDFENILPQLDFLPIAARRALDHAGFRLSLDAWRSLNIDDRHHLISAGADHEVDTVIVGAIVRHAAPPAQRIEAVGDPDPVTPPDALSRLLEPIPLDSRHWARMGPLDRYALLHVHRRSIARNDPSLIQSAYEEIVTNQLRSLAPSGAHEAELSPGVAELPMRVPGPPPLPGAQAAAGGSGLDASVFARGIESGLDAEEDDLRPRSDPWIKADDLLPSSSLDADPLGDDLVFDGDLPSVDSLPSIPQQGTSALSTHLSEKGAARMVNVTEKPVTDRRAVASAVVRMQPETCLRLADRETPKGDVLAAARIAGIMAAKKTSELIPLCHAISLTSVEVYLDIDETTSSVHVTAIARAADRTGVEMEALVAASVASLTVYDMLKGIDRGMTITDVLLVEKTGGRSGHYKRKEK